MSDYTIQKLSQVPIGDVNSNTTVIVETGGKIVRVEVNDISKENTEFFEEILNKFFKETFGSTYELENVNNNLFDGSYVEGIALVGSGSINIASNDNFNSLAIIKVKPNTKYTSLVEDLGKEDTGYYYYKIAAIQDDLPDGGGVVW